MAQLTELLSEIDAAKARLDALRPLEREREARVMQKFRLWWTYHSNAIEGNKLTQGETETFLMEGLTAKGKPIKDHLDLTGHSNAVNHLLLFIRNKEEFSEILIRELHRILLVEPYKIEAITPDGSPTTKMVAIGEYKTSANHVRTPTGEIHYYATPEETPAKMHDLMTWYRNEKAKGEMHSVEVAALFHHRFTAIHPFDDGNGRMSRLLMNLMLMQEGYPPVVLRLSERDQYLAALRRADSGENGDFVSMIATHMIDSLQIFVAAAQGVDVSEPTDLKKEIELELIRLQHIEEPAERTLLNLQELFSHSISELVKETARLLALFCDLFTTSDFSIRSYIINPNGVNAVSTQLDFLNPDLSHHLAGILAGGHIVTNSIANFTFSGFKKARFNTFALDISIQITCEPLKYTVATNISGRQLSFSHFYQERLEREEITVLAQAIAGHVLQMIKNNTKD